MLGAPVRRLSAYQSRALDGGTSTYQTVFSRHSGE